MKALIVDDSSTMRKIIKKTLMQAGVATIVEAEDGIDAMQKMKENGADFDVVLLDINMPRVDGVTTLKQLKAIDETKGIPVIMCTSEAEKEKVVECIRGGASDYIVKPFSKDLIAEKISKVVGK